MKLIGSRVVSAVEVDKRNKIAMQPFYTAYEVRLENDMIFHYESNYQK